jgi:hypothetical protein
LSLAALVFAYTPPPLPRRDVNVQPSSACKDCHLDITQQFQRSAHSKSSRMSNELFYRMYSHSLQVTRGATMTKCGPCHEPVTFINQDFAGVKEESQEGVACAFCHAVEGPGDPQGIPPYTVGLSAYYGAIRNPVPTTNHKSAYTTYLRTSDYCGGCHAYSNQYGVSISDTFNEWRRSAYAKQGITCQTCHMPGAPGRNSYLGPSRARVADHSFSHEALAKARPGAVLLSVKASRAASNDSLRVVVTVTNKGWGHSLPTGNEQNVVVLRVRVKDAQGNDVWQNDPFSEWNRSIFGVILADELGSWPADTWNARSVLENRRIKAGASMTSRYSAPLEGAAGPYTVDAQVFFRRAWPSTVETYQLPDHYGSERLLAAGSVRAP